MAPYDWANGGYVDVFLMVSMVLLLWELMLFLGMSMEFKYKVMLYCLREVKCQQGFTTGI